MKLARGLLKEYASVVDLVVRAADVLFLLVTAHLAERVSAGGYALSQSQWLLALLAAPVVLVIFSSMSIYQSRRGASLVGEFQRVALAWSSVFGLVAIFSVAFADLVEVAREWFLAWFVVGGASVLGLRALVRMFLRWARARGFNIRRIVMAGSAEMGGQVLEHLERAPWTGLEIMAFFTAEPDGLIGRPRGLPAPHRLEELPGFVERETVDQVWLAFPLKEERRLQALLHDLRHCTSDIRLVPDIFGFELLNHSVSDVAGLPVINLRSSPLQGVNRLVKEIEDRVLAVFFLLLLSPLFLLIALAVKLDSPGPVLFKQRRHGWDGRPIRVYKFRSMVRDADSGGYPHQARPGDARVTRVGRILRRYSLDELPQFFNVLQGRMSIVGPRPHALEHNERFKDEIDHYMLRHKVKPGITGWAQINGYRGETDTLEKMKKRLEYDLYYIENWSLWFDLRIILLSPWRAIRDPNAY